MPARQLPLASRSVPACRPLTWPWLCAARRCRPGGCRGRCRRRAPRPGDAPSHAGRLRRRLRFVADAPMQVAQHRQVGLAQLRRQRGEQRHFGAVGRHGRRRTGRRRCAGRLAGGRLGVSAAVGGGTGVVERRYQFSPAPCASAAYRRYSKAPASTWPSASAKASCVVCAVVVAPLRALTTSMPLPVVCAPRPPRLVICTVVLPLALAPAPLSTRRSLRLALPPSTVPRLSTPPLPT